MCPGFEKLYRLLLVFRAHGSVSEEQEIVRNAECSESVGREACGKEEISYSECGA